MSSMRYKSRLFLLVLALLTWASSVNAAKNAYGGYTTSKNFSAPRYGNSSGTTGVRGYSKKDGTYVSPHHRTAPNSTQRDNWSSKPNVNPYTGKVGTVEPLR